MYAPRSSRSSWCLQRTMEDAHGFQRVHRSWDGAAALRRPIRRAEFNPPRPCARLREIRQGGRDMRAADHFRAMRGKNPEDAKFFWSGGPIEVAERTWFQSRFSGVTAFETDAGLVLVDSGLAPLAPKLAQGL